MASLPNIKLERPQDDRQFEVGTFDETLRRLGNTCPQWVSGHAFKMIQKWSKASRSADVPLNYVISLKTPKASTALKQNVVAIICIPVVFQQGLSQKAMQNIIRLTRDYPAFFVNALHIDRRNGTAVFPYYPESAQDLVHEGRLSNGEISAIHQKLVSIILAVATATKKDGCQPEVYELAYEKAIERLEKVDEDSKGKSRLAINPSDVTRRPLIVSNGYYSDVMIERSIRDMLEEAKLEVVRFNPRFSVLGQNDEFLGNFRRISRSRPEDPVRKMVQWKLSDYDNVSDKSDVALSVAKMCNNRLWFVLEKTFLPMQKNLSLDSLGYEEKEDEEFLRIKYDVSKCVPTSLRKDLDKALERVKNWSHMNDDFHMQLRLIYYLACVQLSVAAKVENPTLRKILLAEGAVNLHKFLQGVKNTQTRENPTRNCARTKRGS